MTARSTLISIVRAWCEQHPDYPETAEAIVDAFGDESSAGASRREFALEQHVQLLRVALAARGGDSLLTGADMGPVETGPVQSILLNHSMLTHRAEMTLTQPGGVIQTWEMPNVRFAEVKLTNDAPDAPFLSQDYVLAQKRTLTITLEL